MIIELKVLDTEFYSKQDLPAYTTAGSAGVDLRITRDVTLVPGICCLATGEKGWISNTRPYGV
jgi:dUTPase